MDLLNLFSPNLSPLSPGHFTIIPLKLSGPGTVPGIAGKLDVLLRLLSS